MDIEIRLANVGDRQEILQLQSSSLRVLTSKEYRPRQIESLIKSQAEARFKSEVVFVAICQKTIVGFASLLVYKPQIGAVYVNPEFSRQGIGSRLIEVIEKVAVEKGYKSIYVMSSLTAIHFYRKRGYQLRSNLIFFSEGKVSIPCKMFDKQLITFTPTKTTETQKNRQIWILTIVLIVVISIAIASL